MLLVSLLCSEHILKICISLRFIPLQGTGCRGLPFTDDGMAVALMSFTSASWVLAWLKASAPASGPEEGTITSD